jgi:ribose transport system substrate-binding protein
MREKTKKIVGFSQTENIGPWRVAETNSIKAEAAKRQETYEFLMTDAQGQTSKQFSDIEDLIARQVDAIFSHHANMRGLRPPWKRRERQKYQYFSLTVKLRENQAKILSPLLGRISSSKVVALVNG